ncbi:MAG: flagellar brake protein [Bermanella sp.]
MTGRAVDFMGLKLVPGQVFQLEFEGYTSDRDRSILIGYRRNASLIVTTPLINGVLANVKNGESVNVRFFANRLSCACAFKTRVIYASKSPYPHIHFEVPEAVMTGEVRESVRASVEVVTNVEYRVAGNTKVTSAKIIDLSIHGAGVVGKTFEFKAGDTVSLIFTIDIADLAYQIKVKSRVRSMQKIEKGLSVGLQFEDVPDSEKIALQAFVLSKVNDA